MVVARFLAALVAVVALLSSCGGDDSETGTEVTTTTVAATTTSSPVPPLEQPAIWPAAGVAFATPEEAAENFVTEVLGVPAHLGAFIQGDSRSGEIEVLAPGEGDGAPIARSVLALRQLGPDDAWFILAALNDNASIAVPESMAEVAAGLLTVEGKARGYEGNVVVTAFLAGEADTKLDQTNVQAGSAATPEPFTVQLDLSDASPGDVVTLMVRGGVGLETDPGDFGAIPVVIAK